MGALVEPKTPRELFAPITTDTSSYIVLPATNATHFDLKPHVIQVLPSFRGLENEDSFSHVKTFLDICANFKFQKISDESMRLRLFPFSLHDRAKAWLHSNMPGSITSWEILLSKFYNKFFLMHKINDLHWEINGFIQEEDKKFCDSWERFKEPIIKCPPHGFERWPLVQFFYNGLTQQNRNMLESMNGGGFLNLIGDEGYTMSENISGNSH